MPKVKPEGNASPSQDNPLNLPPLPWSDDPKHIAGQRRIDEGGHRAVQMIMKLSDALEIYKDCPNKSCKRLKRCQGTKVAKSGRLIGLMHGLPECMAFRNEIREVLGSPQQVREIAAQAKLAKS